MAGIPIMGLICHRKFWAVKDYFIKNRPTASNAHTTCGISIRIEFRYD